MFRKIWAKDLDYKAMEYKFNSFFSKYENYVRTYSLNLGEVSRENTGTARSYKGYLIRIFILVEEITGIQIKRPLDINTYQLVKNIRQMPGYKEFNKNEGYFPNSAINYYLSLVTKVTMEQETELDNISNEFDEVKLNSKPELEEVFYESEISQPVIAPEPIELNNVKRYRRNILAVKKAKESANWICEFDEKHVTFINNFDKKPFVEAHHLIPMSIQDLFIYSIDIPDNIICLCPNCHRRIHYGVKTDKREMINKFYKDRVEKINEYKISCELKDLELFYGI
ncbi:HNH endonuclease [Macrococcoides caseolyticum]|uniref:HNH endonuclease n=1 Tax=Macrococcoides caseolyticum TaxID=69966 RepID=UPI001F48EDAF|nr:HNH endonuclease [Macrococcus caseolyticus]MCE4957997.1 HNH endonuclease [Macrococcus caseolyticus]